MDTSGFDKLKAHELRPGDVLLKDGELKTTIVSAEQCTDPKHGLFVSVVDDRGDESVYLPDDDVPFVRGAQYEGALADEAQAKRVADAAAEEERLAQEREAAALQVEPDEDDDVELE